MTSDTYQQQQKCHQNQLHRGRRRRKTTTTAGASRSASAVTALCLCLHVLIMSPHRCWADVPPTASPVSASPTASPSVSSSPTATPSVSLSNSSSPVVSRFPSSPVSALGTDSPVAPTQAPTEGGPLLAADEPAYGAAAPSINNTVCTTVNMTATQSIEIRSFMFYVETNECITVSVLYKGEGDTNWTPLCAEHDVVGQYPNATVVDHTYCTMVPLLDGETVEFRVQTSPSTTGCAEGGGSVTPIYQPLELMYTYSQMECP